MSNSMNEIFRQLTRLSAKEQLRQLIQSRQPRQLKRATISFSFLINLLTLLLISNLSVLAQANTVKTADVNSLLQPVDLNSYLYYLHDTEKRYTIEQIRSGELDHLFTQNTAPFFVGSDFSGLYWFKLKLRWIGEDDPAETAILYIDTHPINIYKLNILTALTHEYRTTSPHTLRTK